MLIALLLIALLAPGLWGFWIEPSSLVVREHELHLRHWPAELDGLRVAVISDLHAGSPYVGLDKIERVAEAANAARPDLVLLTGDLFTNAVPFGEELPSAAVVQRLGRLQAPLGVHAVFGNHDHHLDLPTLREQFAGVGIHVDDNHSERLKARGGSFWLVGLADFISDAPDLIDTLDAVPAGAPTLAFTHDPDLFPAIPPRVSLLVAGHTHGGQVKLPLLGRLVVPSAYGTKRFAAGHVVEQTDLFVATGIGTTHLPVRFGVPPEISLLVLHGPASGDPGSDAGSDAGSGGAAAPP